tara:strand:- start:96681 stop:98318 length:1638 start_codon:yes stop_codon:yes gene_type:complete
MFRHRPLIVLLFVFIWGTLVCVPATTDAHESGHASADNSAHQGDGIQTARGVVFDDQNGNKKHDKGEPGIANVRVSNGRDIVSTDDQGHYEIDVDNDDIVFVIKPRDWVTPVNDDQLPQFFYIHKPNGSPANTQFAGVAPTGPLPESINFPLRRRVEPDKFKAILFGDPQPRNLTEVEYVAHDVVEQIVREDAHGASFGVTLGDIAFDDLSVMEPQNQAIALIGIPWYNVIGNHDLNREALHDEQSDETFERIYGPAYYSFDFGPTHFLVLDDVTWVGAQGGQKARFHGGLGERQMQFIRDDLAAIPEDQLVVLLMHVPLVDVKDRHELYRLIEHRPATVSISAHTHYMEHRFIGPEDGWRGKQKHHHIVNVTVCGSWWRGRKDERGIPHATMKDGAPNGYTVMQFDGAKYSLDFLAAGRPAKYQMNIYAPEVVSQSDLVKTVVLVNVFNGSTRSQVEMRVDAQGEWTAMQQAELIDPAFNDEKVREEAEPNRTWTNLPSVYHTPHMWRAMMPSRLKQGTHVIEVRAKNESGKEVIDRRIIRVEA